MHTVMMQVSGEGETKGNRMIQLISGLGSGTKWEGNIDPSWVRCKSRFNNPVILNPFNSKDNEVRRVDWLTFKNITDWTDETKHILIQMSMV